MKKYVDKDKLQEYTTKLTAKNKTIFATKNEVGSPLVASTVAEMTDTSRVYVYVGSESGYTSGNWYYYNGSAWISGGIYNSAAVETDTTLSVEGKAADAKAVGDALAEVQVETDTTLTQSGVPADAKATGDTVSELKSALTQAEADENLTWLSLPHSGYYLKSDNTEASNGMLSYTDYIRIPTNAKRVMLGNKTSGAQSATSYTISPNVLFYDENKDFLSFKNVSGQDIADIEIPENAVFLRANQPSAVAINADRLIRFVYQGVDAAVSTAVDGVNQTIQNDIFGFIGGGTFSFSSDKQVIQTTIPVEQNKNYIIVCSTPVNSLVNVYAHSNTNIYSRIYNAGTVIFRSPANSTIDLYNIRGYIGDISISVYDAGLLFAVNQKTPTVYHVGANQAFTSFTACCLALKDDNSEKIIEVDGGDYDIFQEYTDLGLLSGNPPPNPTTGYFDYNVMIPTNTHVIGKGLVRLLWQPTTDQISIAWSQTISPINCAGTMTLENVEIHCKNGRYCIHDDTLGKNEYFGAVKRYKNVKCYKYANDEGYGFGSVIGFGLDARCRYEFDECYFTGPNGNVFYMHDRRKDQREAAYGIANSPSVCAKNCIMDAGGKTRIAIKLGNTVGTPVLDIKVLFEGCYIRGWLDLRDESTATANNGNSFDVTLLNCVKTQINDRYGEGNDYPVQVYNEIGSIAE